MQLMTSLFEPGLLIYSVPLLFSLAVWSLALTGLFNFQIFNFDFHGDGGAEMHLDAHGLENFLQILGFGRIPFSMILTLISFFFGWSGLLLNKFIFPLLSLNINLLLMLGSVFSSLAISLVLSAIVVRPLQPLFKDYGKAGKADEIIGSKAIIRTNSVSDDFGTATVKLEGGIIIEISVRSQKKDSLLKLGDEVLIVEYDKQKNIYLIEPLH